jgi:hypothetical protein
MAGARIAKVRASRGLSARKNSLFEARTTKPALWIAPREAGVYQIDAMGVTAEAVGQGGSRVGDYNRIA